MTMPRRFTVDRPAAGISRAITLEQYRRLDLTRPITDPPIGGTTGARRAVDAQASAAIPVTPTVRRMS